VAKQICIHAGASRETQVTRSNTSLVVCTCGFRSGTDLQIIVTACL